MAAALDTLEYARRLRESGFSEQQAEGQARALAAAMTDALATKDDLRELEARLDGRLAQVDARFERVDGRFERVDARIDSLERHLDTRLVELEKRIEVRFAEQHARISEQGARFDTRLSELEHRMTVRLGGMLIAAIGAFSALVKLL